jgi:hypothetical protein
MYKIRIVISGKRAWINLDYPDMTSAMQGAQLAVTHARVQRAEVCRNNRAVFTIENARKFFGKAV